MKLSIVIPCLNSHEVVRRHMLHFSRMVWHGDTELIVVDDGSEPPLGEPCATTLPCGLHYQLIKTNDRRPWTWALARNVGARAARGEYLLMFDIDHIVPGEAIKFIREFSGHKVQFVREIGVLDEHGALTQDRDVLESYGWPKSKGLGIGPLPNNFAMRKDLFWELGGYREDLYMRPYPQGEDRDFRSKWRTYEMSHGGEGSMVCPIRPRIFMFPNGKYLGDVDADPQGLFHGLTRKTSRNFWHHEQKRKERVES